MLFDCAYFLYRFVFFFCFLLLPQICTYVFAVCRKCSSIGHFTLPHTWCWRSPAPWRFSLLAQSMVSFSAPVCIRVRCFACCNMTYVTHSLNCKNVSNKRCNKNAHIYIYTYAYTDNIAYPPQCTYFAANTLGWFNIFWVLVQINYLNGLSNNFVVGGNLKKNQR